MVKILHIISDSNIGGAGIWLVNTVASMGEEYDIYVALPQNSMLIDRLVHVMDKNHIIEVEGIKAKSFGLRGVANLKNVIKMIKPDVVHAHASLSGRIASRICRVKGLVNTRHCIEPVPAGFKGIVKKWLNNVLSDKIIAVSEAIEDNLLACGVSKEKVALVCNGIVPIKQLPDSKRNDLRRLQGIGETTCVIGFMGRLEEVKGPLYLPEIISELRKKTNQPFKLLIAGDGSQKEMLLKSIETLGISDYVTYLGLIEDITSFYNTIDVLINSSRSEGISLSLVEGMSAKLPLVTFDVDSLNQLISNGVNGFRAKPYEIDEFAEYLRILVEDAEKREAFGNISQKKMNEGFHINRMVKELKLVYSEVLS